MSNLETYEEGSFLLRKGSLVQSIQHVLFHQSNSLQKEKKKKTNHSSNFIATITGKFFKKRSFII